MTVERASRAIVIVATVWFVLAAAWGIDSVPGGGHLGSSGAAVALFGEQMVRWHTFYPLYGWYAASKPSIDLAYCHHPFGVEWLAAFFALFFRHDDFLISLPAVLMSGATPPLLATIGRRFGGPIAGAASAVGFVVLPLAIGYSCFASLEVMTIFGVALFFAGHLAYQDSGRRTHLAASLVGALFAGFGDWSGYLICAPLLAWSVLRTHILPSWMTPATRPRYQHWWALAVSVLVCTLGITIALFKHADKLNEWLSVADNRSGAADTPLKTVLESRTAWIDFSFTPLAIAIGKSVAWLSLIRMLVRRRDEEVMALAVLFGAAVQYITFKRGADVHIFWSHYFAAYFALGMGQLAATAQSTVGWVIARFNPMRARVAGTAAAMVFGILPSVAIFPDGFRSLRIWRETGGRYDDKGSAIRTNVELLWLMQVLVRPQLKAGDVVGVHPGTTWGWEGTWAIAGLSDVAAAPTHDRFWVGRSTNMSSDEIKKLVAARHVRIYGDTFVVDATSERPGPLEAFSLHEHEPNLLEWYFRYNTEPVRSLSTIPDPFLTWEWRDHLAQDPRTPPSGEPTSLDERRIAHNAAIARGDTTGAERLREQIVAELDRTVEAHFTGDHELIGVRVTHGVKPMIEAWFEAGGPTLGDTTFAIHSVVERSARMSFIPIDPMERDMAYPPPLPTKLWKRGYIYSISAELNHRMGQERYFGYFASHDGQPAPAPKHGVHVDLAVVP